MGHFKKSFNCLETKSFNSKCLGRGSWKQNIENHSFKPSVSGTISRQNGSQTQEQAVLSVLSKMGPKTHSLTAGQSLPVWGSQKALLEGD